MRRSVFFVSDRTGITAETLGHSLLTQFEGIEFEKTNLPFIESIGQARDAVTRINAAAARDGNRPLVFSTLIDAALREAIEGSDGVVFDFFATFIDPLETELGVSSSHAVGRSHGMGAYTDYQARIDAVNFALANDDGVSTRNYARAGIVLIGVSRCGKTPTCLYLALRYGIHAANYPLTEDDLRSPRLPDALEPFKSMLFGLTIDPARLHQIRSERRPDSRYASLDQCRFEVRTVEALYKNEDIPFLDTSSMSIEEIAATVRQHADQTANPENCAR